MQFDTCVSCDYNHCKVPLKKIKIPTAQFSYVIPSIHQCMCGHSSHFLLSCPLYIIYCIVGNFRGVQISFCAISSWFVFNFRSVHFTQENTSIITCVLCVKFVSIDWEREEWNLDPTTISRHTVLNSYHQLHSVDILFPKIALYDGV